MSTFQLGLDRSGNANHFNVAGINQFARVIDTPTNNFSTMNPDLKTLYDRDGGSLTYPAGNPTYSEGFLEVITPNSGSGNTVSTIGVESGKWYAEVYVVAYSSLPRHNIGITGDAEGTILAATNFGSLSTSLDVGYFFNGTKFIGNSESTNAGASYAVGDVMGIALNVDDSAVTFYKNNASQFTQAVTAGGTYHFVIGDVSAGGGSTYVINFGQDSSFAGRKTPGNKQDGNSIGDFFYAPPAGFLALCTENLPEPDIIPTDYFSSVTYAGDAQDDRTVTGVGFSPGFVWSKAFTTTYNHFMVDTVRGVNAYVNSNRTNAESSDTDILKSFDADGYTLGNSGNMNENNHSHVAWNWYLGGTGAANTEGSLNTTKTQASTASGFSIVTYTGNATEGATLGHGLTKAPEWFMTKKRGASGGWMVYHIGNTAAPETDELNLEVTEATQDSANIWNDTAPTATVFSLGNNAAVNANNVTFVAFLWHSVEGYSRFGNYTGNGIADGPFVYLGFKPAFVLTKRTDDADNWRLTDNARDPFNNGAIGGLKANATDSEADTGNRNFDYLSNGFKVRETDVDMNADGGNYIYMAFAEVPLKYASAR